MSTHAYARAPLSAGGRCLFVFVGLVVFLAGAPAVARAGNPVLEWNQIAQELLVVPALSPVQQTRAMAIVHTAIHDAVNGITGEYAGYAAAALAPAGTSPEAAAIAAAYTALQGIVGDSELLMGKYAASLEAHAIGADDPGVAFGRAAAHRVLILRQHDGAATAAFAYLPAGAGAPGIWVPVSAAMSAQALLPGWGQVTPWVLRSGSQFRPEAPPALDGERYARDYAEVVRLGGREHTDRTDEQSQIALFWRGSPTAIWSPVLRQTLEWYGLDVADAARAAALVYLAAADASVACWEAKYAYDFWRPQAAIASGHLDGNPATAGDPDWRPFLPTPPHPEYPSAHAANSGAMAFVLARLFGDDPGFVIEATLPQSPGFTRSWRTFSEGVHEVIDARIYSGIHFRSANQAGARMGRQVAQFVLTHALRRARRR